MHKLLSVLYLSLAFVLLLLCRSVSSAEFTSYDLEYRDILKKITNEAMADHDAARYVKAGLGALANTYQLDVRKALAGLNNENAADVFSAAMREVMKDNPGIQTDQLQKTAIDAMLKLIDARSKFIDVLEFENMRRQTGKWGGIGVVLAKDDKGIRIVEVVARSPASRAGINRNSYLLSVNEDYLRDMPLAEVVALLKGRPGKEVAVSVMAANNQINKYTLARDIIHEEYSQLEQLDNHTLYIRVKQLGYNLSKQLRKDLKKIDDLASKALIVDLRNSTGGILDSAIEFIDLFLTEGALVTIRHKQAQNDMQFNTRKGDELEFATPVAVLVDANTASGSELIALALRTRKDSRVIGSRTYGIAGIRTILPLKNNTALMMTTAKMVLADGTSWHGQGVQPDVCVDYGQNLLVKDKTCYKSEYQYQEMANDIGLQQAIEFVKQRLKN